MDNHIGYLNKINLNYNYNFKNTNKYLNLSDVLINNTSELYGGNINIDYNKKFIKTDNKYIKNQYSSEIVSLLRKALGRLNANGIFLDKNIINKIEKRLKDLENVEKKLSFLAENMVDGYNYDKMDNSMSGGI
jgi:hypothetical protein